MGIFLRIISPILQNSGRKSKEPYFIDVVHKVDCIVDEKERDQELEKLGDEILRRNDMIFFSGVMNQAFPMNRSIGGRWFDELGWEAQILEAVQED